MRSKVGNFYLDLNNTIINLLPDSSIPDDDELIHIMTAAEFENNDVAAAKWQPLILERGLGKKLEEFIDIIRTASIGFSEGSIHAPPPCAFSPSSPTIIASSLEPLIITREVLTVDRASCSANLAAGWRKWSPSQGREPPAVRASSAGPSAGSSQQPGLGHYDAPWNQNIVGPGQEYAFPAHRGPRTEKQMMDCKVSTFWASPERENALSNVAN